MTAAKMGSLEGTTEGVTLFGITLTSKVLGILIGLLGIGGAAYGTFIFTLPEQDTASTIESQINQLRQDIDNQQAIANLVTQKERDLVAANTRSNLVLSLLPSVDNIDTLISDLNRQIPPRTAVSLPNGISLGIDSRLRSFTPAVSASTDKFDTFSFNINFDSTFPAAIEAIQNIEKLQSFLVIKDIKITKGEVSREELTIPAGFEVDPADLQKIVANLTPKVSVSFRLEAYVPKKADAVPTETAPAQ